MDWSGVIKKALAAMQGLFLFLTGRKMGKLEAERDLDETTDKARAEHDQKVNELSVERNDPDERQRVRDFLEAQDRDRSG